MTNTEDDPTAAEVRAASERVAAHRRARTRARGLEIEIDAEKARCARLQEALRAETDDVEALEGWTLTRLLATLRGRRDEDLAREEAEAAGLVSNSPCARRRWPGSATTSPRR